MIINLTIQNIPKLAGSYDGVKTIYVRQYGAGNLRLAATREELIAGVNLPPGGAVDGIPQAAAQGVVQYFWSGDLYLISDNPGDNVMVYCPAQAFSVDRSGGIQQSPSDISNSASENDLSTY